MSRPLRIASLVLPLVAVLSLTACGGSEQKNDYVRKLNDTQVDFKRSTESVAQQKVPDGAAAKIRMVQRFERALDQVVSALRGIEVPSYVRAEHQQLIDVMTGFRADVRKLTETYRGGDARKVSAELVVFKSAEAEANARITATIDAINSKLAAT
jgi:hypothetical protein